MYSSKDTVYDRTRRLLDLCYVHYTFDSPSQLARCLGIRIRYVDAEEFRAYVDHPLRCGYDMSGVSAPVILIPEHVPRGERPAHIAHGIGHHLWTFDRDIYTFSVRTYENTFVRPLQSIWEDFASIFASQLLTRLSTVVPSVDVPVESVVAE